MKKEEFEFHKKILKIKEELSTKLHKQKMERLQYERETQRIFHEKSLERERIKSAEIRKNMMRKQGDMAFKF